RRQHERVSTLSRGLVQRLSWARALLHTPPLLLLDEADTGLDQSGRELIDSFLAEHTMRGSSTLFITHQLERALQLSDHILLLASGRIVYQQETAQLTLEELQQRYQEVVRLIRGTSSGRSSGRFSGRISVVNCAANKP